MTAKIVELKAHREGKAAAPVVTPAPATHGPTVFPREQQLLIQSISYMLKKAGYSNEVRLSVLLPILLPAGHKDLWFWQHDTQIILAEEFARFPDWLKGL
jgi:hypothetical protein